MQISKALDYTPFLAKTYLYLTPIVVAGGIIEKGLKGILPTLIVYAVVTGAIVVLLAVGEVCWHFLSRTPDE